MVFTGTYEHTIDSKSRLAVPAVIRSGIQREAGAGEGDAVYLYVTLGEGGILCLYTEQRFEQRADDLDDSELDADELLDYERLLFSLAQRVELDKQGRIRLPESLLKRTTLASEITLIGVKDHLEVWDRATWSDYEQSLQSQRRMLRTPRQAMRRGKGSGA